MKRSVKNKDSNVAMLLTAKEMSKLCGIGENTLRKLMDAGELEYLPIGKHRLLRKQAIWDYYKRNKCPVQTKATIEEYQEI